MMKMDADMLEKENNYLRERITELEKTNQELLPSQRNANADIATIKNTLAEQKLLLDTIANTLHPVRKNFNIFPLKTLDEVKEVDEILSSNSKEEVIAYVRSIIGITPVNQCVNMFFSEEVLSEINWDGRQKKFAVNKLKFFTDILYIAANGPQIGLKQFEDLMKKGFRRSKNRMYKLKRINPS